MAIVSLLLAAAVLILALAAEIIPSTAAFFRKTFVRPSRTMAGVSGSRSKRERVAEKSVGMARERTT